MNLRLKRFALLCAALAMASIAALTGLSRAWQQSDPVQALRFNPFNADAGNARMAQGLTSPDNAALLPALAASGRETVRFSPINALARSLLGEVYLGMGDTRTADALFEAALSLSKTEANALLRTVAGALEDGDIEAVMARLDILFRRWPEQLDAFVPVMPGLLESPDGYRTMLETLRTKPPWRPKFLAALSKDPGGLELAYGMQLDLGAGGAGALRHEELAGTLSALIRAGRYGAAHRLFLLTLSDADRQHSGYVFNGDFALEPSGRPFDWGLRSSSGASLKRVAASRSGAAVEMRFLGKPVRTIALRQHLHLQPGRYRLALSLDAAGLNAPKGLFLNIACLDPRADIIRLDIPDGSYRDRTLVGEFELPDDRCGLFRLGFATDLIAKSMRYAYFGTVTIRAVELSRIGA